MAQTTKTPRTGRPPALDKVVRTDPGGRQVTAADALILGAQLGLEIDDCARSANVSKQTLYNWKREGAKAHEKAAAGGLKALTAKERRYFDFVDAFERALIEFEMGRLANIHRAGAGGATIKETRTTTRRDKRNGEVVTEVVVIERTALPTWQADAWLLERRLPAKYRRRVEVTGADGGPVIPPAERADNVAQAFEEYLEAQASASSDEAARSVRGAGLFPGD